MTAVRPIVNSGIIETQSVRLIWALREAQIHCMGSIQGQFLTGVDFLANVAAEYRACLSSHAQNYSLSREMAETYTKHDLYHRTPVEGVLLLRSCFSVITDISAFIQTQVWAVERDRKIPHEAIGEALLR